MANWIAEIEFRKFLGTDDPIDEKAAKIEEAVKTQVKNMPIGKRYRCESLIPLVEELKRKSELELEESDIEVLFDAMLDRIYNYCDANRIWVKF